MELTNLKSSVTLPSVQSSRPGSVYTQYPRHNYFRAIDSEIINSLIFVSTVWINLVGLSLLLLICCYGGMVIFAKYANCDPLSAKVSESTCKKEHNVDLFIIESIM